MNIVRSLVDTFISYLQAFKAVLTTGRLLALFTIPWILGVAMWGVLFYFSLGYRELLTLNPAALSDAHMYLEGAPWIGDLIEGAILPLLFIVTGVIAVLISLIINEFTIDPFLIHFFKIAVPHSDLSLTRRSVISQLIDSVIRMIIVAPLTILCFLLGLIPIIGLPFIALSFFVIGFALLDLPLCVLNYSFQRRIRFIFSNFLETLWLGGGYSLTFFIPGLSIILLPFGYGAAIYIIAKRIFPTIVSPPAQPLRTHL